jgi:uncharacterized repeat protein (TIGR01451 family)
MRNRTSVRQILTTRLRRHWVLLLVTGFFGVVLLAGAPAWAAPVVRPLSQTVPRPTPTSVFAPVPTATPRPDTPSPESLDGADQDAQDGGEIELGEEADPSDLFPVLPGEGNQPAEYGATVGVTALNVREGPGTNFAVIGSLVAETRVTVLARNDDASWWYICCLPNTTTNGWASALLLNPDFDRGAALTLLPLFGTEVQAAPVGVAAQATAIPRPQQAPQPLQVGFAIDPPFVWQGITATMTISVSNPNAIDVLGAELSDELPAALTLVEARARAGGTVETIITPSGRPLLLFRWERIPAGTGVAATIVVRVSDELAPGEVIDNLVGVRARNAAYNAGAITLGMPPLLPPVFD